MHKCTKVLLAVFLFTGGSLQAQATLTFSLDGNAAADSFGASVSGVGDVNGDGTDDFIVGAPQNFAVGAGYASVFSGLDGSVLHTFLGDTAGDLFGASVNGAGDVNNDGFADLIVGASYNSFMGFNTGMARVFSGMDGSVLYTFRGSQNNVFFGGSVSGAGDVNGDGFDDLIVGAHTDRNGGVAFGSAQVFSGLDGSVIHAFFGDAANDAFGFAVDGIGDVDGDGFDDVIVGAVNALSTPFQFGNGMARVFSGFDGSIIYTFIGDSIQDQFGTTVAAADDVDNDGTLDFMVGTPRDSNNGALSGSVKVFSGATGSILHVLNGSTPSENFGTSLGAIGDVNQDGYADIIVGTPKADLNGIDSGSVRIYSGLDGTLLHTFNGGPSSDNFGVAVSGSIDINGDGVNDLLIGLSQQDNNGTDSGSVEVFQMPAPLVDGLGQANSTFARLEVNQGPTGSTKGPFASTITRGQLFTLDFSGAPLALYEVYASATLSPGGWDFGPFGLFDLGTGPSFADVFVLLPGFQSVLSLYSMDLTGQSQLSFFVHPSLPVGPSFSIQALVQNPQPWTNGHWGTLTAAHQLIVN